MGLFRRGPRRAERATDPEAEAPQPGGLTPPRPPGGAWERKTPAVPPPASERRPPDPPPRPASQRSVRDDPPFRGAGAHVPARDPDGPPPVAAAVAPDTAPIPAKGQPAWCPEHGARTQDGWSAAHGCNAIVGRESGIPLLCGKRVYRNSEEAAAAASPFRVPRGEGERGEGELRGAKITQVIVDDPAARPIDIRVSVHNCVAYPPEKLGEGGTLLNALTQEVSAWLSRYGIRHEKVEARPGMLLDVPNRARAVHALDMNYDLTDRYDLGDIVDTVLEASGLPTPDDSAEKKPPLPLNPEQRRAVADALSIVERLRGPYEVYGGVEVEQCVKGLRSVMDDSAERIDERFAERPEPDRTQSGIDLPSPDDPPRSYFEALGMGVHVLLTDPAGTVARFERERGTGSDGRHLVRMLRDAAEIARGESEGTTPDDSQEIANPIRAAAEREAIARRFDEEADLAEQRRKDAWDREGRRSSARYEKMLARREALRWAAALVRGEAAESQTAIAPEAAKVLDPRNVLIYIDDLNRGSMQEIADADLVIAVNGQTSTVVKSRQLRSDGVKVTVQRGAPTDTFEADTRLLSFFGPLYRIAWAIGTHGMTRGRMDELRSCLALPPDIEAAVEGPRGHDEREEH